ncbi:MAG: peptidyl-tRNA hydrolase Pth2 [Candidatus Aenigmatarchaeota archaeon]
MYKQVIIFRNDIVKKIGIGKTAAHSAHASLGSLKKVGRKIIEKWELEGAKKVVLRVENLKELKKIEKMIKKEKIPCFLVKDAGLTRLKAGTITCLGIGPIEEEKIDKITGKLKLL